MSRVEEALEIRLHVLGPDHPDVAASLSLLAELYADRGKDMRALLLEVRVQAIREKALGQEKARRDAATSPKGLAHVDADQGDCEPGSRLCKQSGAIRASALSELRPGVVRSLKSQALRHWTWGDHAQAAVYMKRFMEIRDAHLGRLVQLTRRR